MDNGKCISNNESSTFDIPTLHAILPLSQKRIHTHCWLIENQQFWIVHQSNGERYSSLLATAAIEKGNNFIINERGKLYDFLSISISTKIYISIEINIT